jgi:phosphatidylglycerophosphate synthase
VSNGTIHSVLADGNAASTGLAAFTPEAVESVRKARSSTEALQKLARTGGLRAVSLEPHFCERLVKGSDAGRVEHDYIRHLNGGSGESFFTKRIRRLSIPLSRRLLRLPITANQVTMLGLALSVLAGVAFGAGGYWAGLVGAALYYASTVFDCSDGEVARAKYCESAFGCWLETWVDYASYVFALAGMTWTTIRSYGYGAYAQAAALAVGASLLRFALVNHFRRRVAAANPGQFDDSVAATFAAEGAVYRFSGWARQWIKRSSLTHVLLVLALINQLHVVLFLWAFGASTALVLGLTVRRLLLSRVTVTELRATPSVGVSTHA